MKIRIGNLSPKTKQEDLHKAFAAYGTVTNVDVIADEGTGQPKGFAYVEMANPDEGNKAIMAMNDHKLQGQTIAVTEASTEGKHGIA